jgi:hypothetical protein
MVRPRFVTVTGTVFNLRRIRLESAPNRLVGALRLDQGHGLPVSRSVIDLHCREHWPSAVEFRRLLDADGGGRVEVAGELTPGGCGFDPRLSVASLRIVGNG